MTMLRFVLAAVCLAAPCLAATPTPTPSATATPTPPADEFSVQRLRIRIKRGKIDADSFRLSGRFRFNALPPISADEGSFTVGPHTEAIAAGALELRGREIVFAERRRAGVTSLTIDLITGEFRVGGKAIDLGGTTSPVPVRLEAGGLLFSIDLVVDAKLDAGTGLPKQLRFKGDQAGTIEWAP